MAVAPRSAATVVLLRDGRDGVEAYLQRRPARMGFAGGLWVFPGGRVDEADGDPAVDASWAGPSPADWAGRLGLGVDEARGHVVAACRETLEEAGLLLATPAPGVGEVAEARHELLAGSAGLAGLLGRLGVRLDTDRLRYWAWWVTPEEEPRRYDTRFFVAGLPAAADQGLTMLPPTRYTLRDLAAFGSVAEALAAAAGRRVERILPVLDGAELVMPWGERYPVPAPLLEAAGPGVGGPDERGGRGGRPAVGA